MSDPSPDLGTRALARLVDWAVVLVPGYIGVLVFGIFNPMAAVRPHGSETAGPQQVGIVLAVLFIAYEPAMLAWRSQTIGKWATGIRVKLPEDKPIGLLVALRRHVVSIVFRLGWIVAMIRFMDNSSTDGGFIAEAQNRIGNSISSAMLLAVCIFAGLNLVLLVVGGRSAYDRIGGTTVVVNAAQPDPPLGALTRKLADVLG